MITIKKKLGKLFIVSIFIRLFVFLFGPYSYKINSYDGIIYMFAVDILFLLSLLIPLKKKEPMNNAGEIKHSKPSKAEEYILMIFLILSFVFFALWLFDWNRSIGFDQLFSDDDIRRLVSEKRTNLGRISEFGAPIGAIPFLISNSDDRFNDTICKKLSSISVFFSGIISFSSGARWGIVSSIALFIIVKYQNRKRNGDSEKAHKKGSKYTPIVLVAAYFVFRRIISLFQNRGINHGASRYLFHSGDTVLKPWWTEALRNHYSLVDTIGSISMYIAHPIPTFAAVFEQYRTSRIFYGANMFRIVLFFLGFINMAPVSYKEIYDECFSGLYTSYIYGYVVDWGWYLAPIFIIATGLIFSYVEGEYKNHNRFKCLYPLIEVMVIFSPYYYFFQIGAMDFIIFWLIAYSLLKKCFTAR